MNRTQQAITALIDSTKADGSSSVLLSGPGGERDRPVFDPRDYKIEALPTQFALGAWKKWRHEVGMYIDTIGPSWRGIKLLLQQAHHYSTPRARSHVDGRNDRESDQGQQGPSTSRRSVRLPGQGRHLVPDVGAQAQP